MNEDLGKLPRTQRLHVVLRPAGADRLQLVVSERPIDAPDAVAGFLVQGMLAAPGPFAVTLALSAPAAPAIAPAAVIGVKIKP